MTLKQARKLIRQASILEILGLTCICIAALGAVMVPYFLSTHICASQVPACFQVMEDAR